MLNIVPPPPPSSPLGAVLQRAIEHHLAGRFAAAETLYRQVLQQNPTHAETLHKVGILALQTQRLDLAIDLMGRAIQVQPSFPDAHNNLGMALRKCGRLAEAIVCFRTAIAQRPDFSAALNNLGTALHQGGQLAEAAASFRQAIALNSNFPQAWFNLGLVLNTQGDVEKALAAYQRAVAIEPNLPEAHFNIGVAMRAANRLDDAVAAYRHAVAFNPNYVDAYTNLGGVLFELGQVEDAIAACRCALAIKPDFPELHSCLILSLNYRADQNIPAITEELRQWNRRHAEPLRALLQPHTNLPDPSRRLRIGYVSADFKDHPCACFLIPLLSAHDACQVEVFCYSQVGAPDAYTQRFQSLCHAWRSTAGMSDDDLAGQIRRDAIDILVDLNLHTAGNRLLTFARKPAPVQVTWLGYPGSTGLATMDYRLSDPYLDPPGIDESIYAEQTVRLPDSFWCYDPTVGGDLPVNPLPAVVAGTVTFASLNASSKINPETLALWAAVLQRVPRSRLLLLAFTGSARQRTTDLLAGHGIEPDRIEFITRQSRRDYMACYHRVDLALDTFPYNGHTTSLDALWMGVPVVTRVGHTAVARAGWCFLSNLGLTELVAHTPEEFAIKAVELAQDLQRLQHLRSTLRSRMQISPLMDGKRFARHMESAFRHMWQAWCMNSERGSCSE